MSIYVPLRLRAAWAALRGRPVAYRLHVRGTLVITGERGVFGECRFQPAGPGAPLLSAAGELPTPPHCDQSVLHAPGECRFCDECPDWQAYRQLAGIAFTGHEPKPLYDGGPPEAPCPSDYRRGTGHAYSWQEPTDRT